VVALVLGPLMEKSLRQTLFMMRGDVGLLLERPLTLVLLLGGLAALVGPALARIARRRAAPPNAS
jgi:putative tricarboxylic transport membrane protein